VLREGPVASNPPNRRTRMNLLDARYWLLCFLASQAIAIAVVMT
jgi:hypothetical protein